jgi:hypothetical protein
VTGDWREEIIVLDRNELHVHENRADNPRPTERRGWGLLCLACGCGLNELKPLSVWSGT